MLCKITLGHGDPEQFHIGDRPRSLVGCYRYTGLPVIDAQFGEITALGIVVDYLPTVDTVAPIIRLVRTQKRYCLL